MRKAGYQFRLADTFVMFWACGLIAGAIAHPHSLWHVVLVGATAIWGASTIFAADNSASRDSDSGGCLAPMLLIGTLLTLWFVGVQALYHWHL